MLAALIMLAAAAAALVSTTLVKLLVVLVAAAEVLRKFLPQHQVQQTLEAVGAELAADLTLLAELRLEEMVL
jgi:hypothetical protein